MRRDYAYNEAMKKLLGVVCALALAACSREYTSSSSSSSSAESAPQTAQASAPAKNGLPGGMTRVTDPSQVCMVNDQFMGKPQIPVEVEGRTYYGCCAMCKEKLNTQPAARLAQDPVTGETVDKSKAVIVQDPQGRVKYFASEATLSKYRG
jgi:YHS domain-containing protein